MFRLYPANCNNCDPVSHRDRTSDHAMLQNLDSRTLPSVLQPSRISPKRYVNAVLTIHCWGTIRLYCESYLGHPVIMEGENMNIVNMAMKYVGPMVAERIAAKLGIGGPLANKLIAAALPMILGSVMGKSKSSSGLSTIMNMVTGANKPDAGGLLSVFEGGGDADAFAKSGGGMLEGLLGGQGVGALAGALGKYGGVDSDKAGSLMGMLAPAALGSVGNVVAEQNLRGEGKRQQVAVDHRCRGCGTACMELPWRRQNARNARSRTRVCCR